MTPDEAASVRVIIAERDALSAKLRTEKAAATEANSAIRRLATAVGDALELCDAAEQVLWPSANGYPSGWTLDPAAVRAALGVGGHPGGHP